MKLSVVIPMFNESAHIARTLRSIAQSALAANIAYEAIVVDNGSSDDGPVLAKQGGARVISAPGLTIAALRNLGVANSDGDSLAFVDADMEMPAPWLSLWQSCVAEQRADLLALVHAAPDCAPWYARLWAQRIRAQRPRADYYTYLPSANLCLSRQVFLSVGGFDERLKTGEDKDLSLRLHASGARLLSLPEPVALHWGYEKTFAEWLRKEFWRQTGHGDLLIKAGLRPRTLRFPLLAIGHWLADALVLGLLLTGQATWALPMLAASTVPALLLAGRHRRNRTFGTLPGLWLLHWLRQHVGGLAVIHGLRLAMRQEN